MDKRGSGSERRKKGGGCKYTHRQAELNQCWTNTWNVDQLSSRCSIKQLYHKPATPQKIINWDVVWLQCTKCGTATYVAVVNCHIHV